MPSDQSVNALLDTLSRRADRDREVSVADVVSDIGDRGIGPLLFVPALLVLSPLGAIPVVPSLFAAALFLIAVQSLFGESRIWLPQVVRERAVEEDSIRQATKRLRPWADRLDRLFGPRLKALTTRPVQNAAAVLAAILCLSVPPLELVPFAALVPMLAIALLGLAITLNDGILMAVALTGAGVALIGSVWLLISG
ncbi:MULTISPECIES: exopolysaccharide biosynthesis protein [Salipiger]|uniref:exopolysaccharide biosynthesis protein n=1 Tax=Salipiger TaxID=263377 RepID=UPI0030094D87